MPTIAVDPREPDADALDRASAVLRAGGLVAFPTETVYGLGAHALDAAAVRRIFEAKGRPPYNPVIVHVVNVADARALVTSWPEAAQRAADAFWPGPLTLVLPKRAEVPSEVTAGRLTVAIRIPSHPVARALLERSGLPIAAPSANRFTELSPTTARHVEKALGDRVSLILDGGPTSGGIESTVVDLSGDRPLLLRPGLVDESRLAQIVGALSRPAPAARHDEPRAAPGMVDRHYAPRARVLLVHPADAGAIDAVRAALHAEDAAGGKTGLLVRTLGGLAASHVITVPAGPSDYARELYASLHALDDSGCSLIAIEAVPDSIEWDGIRDRLLRASHR